MDMRKIECFLKVAETLNFAAAAKALYITPQALTQQISRFEAELGTRLFERNTRTVALTENGHFAYEQLAPAKKVMNQAIESVRANIAQAQEHIRIGFFSGLPKNEILNPCLSKFTEVFGIENITMMSGSMDALMNDFTNGRIDVLVTNVDQDFPLEQYEMAVLCETPAQITVSIEHPWAAQKSVTENDMSSADMVQFSTPDTKKRKGFFASLPHREVRFVEDFDAMLAMIESGAYFGVFPDTFDSSKRALFKYFPLPNRDMFLFRTICVCNKGGRNSKVSGVVSRLNRI